MALPDLLERDDTTTPPPPPPASPDMPPNNSPYPKLSRKRGQATAPSSEQSQSDTSSELSSNRSAKKATPRKYRKKRHAVQPNAPSDADHSDYQVTGHTSVGPGSTESPSDGTSKSLSGSPRATRVGRVTKTNVRDDRNDSNDSGAAIDTGDQEVGTEERRKELEEQDVNDQERQLVELAEGHSNMPEPEKEQQQPQVPQGDGPAARAERKKMQEAGVLPKEEQPSEAVRKSSRVGDTHCTPIYQKAGMLSEAGSENGASIGDRIRGKVSGK